MKFKLGRLTGTHSIAERLQEDTEFRFFVLHSINRYCACDWGELSDYDKRTNNTALANGNGRILAAYACKELQSKILIITDADRSFTTVLFPQEY